MVFSSDVPDEEKNVQSINIKPVLEDMCIDKPYPLPFYDKDEDFTL